MTEENENETPQGAEGEAAEPVVPEAAEAPAAETPPEEDPHAVRIVELEGEVARMRDQLLRAMAETENLRKRAERQVEDAHRYAVAGFARDILSIGDNLERALDAIPDDRRGEHELLQILLEGVIAVQSDFLSVLSAHKIERLDPMGEPFDPNLHEAMYEVPDSDLPNGSVAHVMQAGYRLHDRLLRAARVGVAKSATVQAPSAVGEPAADAPATDAPDKEEPIL
ncbi:MAG: nucleotide exchange factor GrpE [Rhodospirillaceae bacterium]|nr:nucleotide exchange factor GrpE [Rhodospirillaceae bacterium]